jgi:hypothetical protein
MDGLDGVAELGSIDNARRLGDCVEALRICTLSDLGELSLHELRARIKILESALGSIQAVYGLAPDDMETVSKWRVEVEGRRSSIKLEMQARRKAMDGEAG